MWPEGDQSGERLSSSHCPRVLTFHKLLPHLSFGVSNFSPRRLGRLLEWMNETGFRIMSIREALSDRSGRAVALTFDDGYAHLAQVLPSLMDKHNFSATIFVPTAFIGRSNSWDYSHLFTNTPHLGKDAIRELAQAGVDFGTHGHTHCDLTRGSDDKLLKELRTSKRTLEDVLGTAVTSISYPFGRLDRRVIDAAGEEGYTHGFTMQFPTLENYPLALGRLPVYSFDTRLSILRKLSHGPLVSLERAKSTLATRLSTGTSLLNRLRRYEPD
jgi:peptidoglycan/xylan/chitin deacetylase (PgdA/CDA1 family)